MDKCDVRGWIDYGQGPEEIICQSTVPHEVHYFVIDKNIDNPTVRLEHKNIFGQKG